MSTTVELGKATAEIARLRAAIKALADEWEHPAEVYALRMSAAPRLRALLDES